MSLEAIGERVGKHPSTVSYWLKKHGLSACGRRSMLGAAPFWHETFETSPIGTRALHPPSGDHGDGRRAAARQPPSNAGSTELPSSFSSEGATTDARNAGPQRSQSGVEPSSENWSRRSAEPVPSVDTAPGLGRCISTTSIRAGRSSASASAGTRVRWLGVAPSSQVCPSMRELPCRG